MGNVTAKTSGEIVNFMTPAETNITSLKVHFSPKQLGTGDPSPENVREIEGWDGVDGYNDPKYGGNIVWNQCFDLSTLKIGSGTSNNFNVTKLDTGFRATTNADVSGSGSRVVYFTVKWNRIQNHRYIFLCKIKGNTLKFSSFYIYHANGSSNRPAQNSTEQYVMTETYTGTTSDSNSSLRLYIYGCTLLEGESFEVTDLMAIDLDMMFGTTVIDNLFNNTTTALQRVDWFISIITNYDYRDYNEGELTTVSAVNNEPYANLSINWSSNIGTIYGGYVDLISGELVQDIRYKQITADALSNAGDSIGYTSNVTALDGQSAVWIRNLFNSTARGRKSGGIKANCNAFKVLMNSTGVSSSQNRTAFAVDGESITSVADFISTVETLEQNGNGLYLAYELATPITHQLTPTQLQSFVGQNNFWSNADYVEIEYDLIETIDIQKARQKIILNQPHTESLIGDVANFTTNMKAPLKECRIYFEPVQEGEGDPSPDNIRPVSGWEEMNLNVTGTNLWGGNIVDTSSGKRLSSYGATGGYPRLNKYINPNTYIISVICNLPNGVTQESWAKSYNIRTSFKSAIDGKWYEIVNANTGELRSSTNTGSVLFTWTQPADISSTPTKFVSHPFKLTIPVSCIALGFYKYGNYLEYTSIQLEVGNTASDIEPYNGTTIPISWQSEVDTVYGGYIDLVTGELVGTYTYQTFDGDEPWSVYGSDVYRFALQPSNGFPKKKNGQNNVICDSYSAHGYNSNYYVALSGTQALYPTAQDLKDALSQNPIHACYELLEPIHYQLTPQQLLTLKGINNIWSDTNGQTEVKFWTH